MNLYLVAVLPPEPVLGHVWALKQEIHERTGSRNAIRLPPHITLIPPTRQPADFEAAATAALQEFAAAQSAFAVGLHNFAWFGKRTLFVHVAQPVRLQQFQAELQQWCSHQLPAIQPETRPFTPHMTLATRDLPVAQVPLLQQEFAQRTYSAHFIVSSMQLFRHTGQQWESIMEFTLGNEPEV
ncbi:2'-5' RNA ligase [Hymenobacter gelipurpurascens]|uniref:2'-5' RNA ligase n=1 Tax=Hymenobacter gelipurpurascens TaxID=89968 RepID=A0A212TDC4_9BACT|nr:2'-5' RNA ligase family protein [Hymenobacter gelipurpurascens]SNC63836.1 2'-5' RNA ligase [Hymenobacter gelipurpurascens]